MALVPSRGRVYAWGLGGAGQLGNHSTRSVTTPQVVHGPWITPNGSTIMDVNKQFNSRTIGYIVKHIFTGGDHCFATVISQNVSIFTIKFFTTNFLTTTNKIYMNVIY